MPGRPKKPRGKLPRQYEARLLKANRMDGKLHWALIGSKGKARKGEYLYGKMATPLKTISTVMRVDFQKIISRTGQASILDAGCGEGAALQELRERFPDSKRVELTGVALNKSPAWKNKSVKWVVCPFSKLRKKFPEKKFDLIYSYFGLEHSPDIKRDSGVLSSLLKENGLLVATMPAWEKHHEYNELIQRKPDYFAGQMHGLKLENAFLHRPKGESRRSESWILWLRKA